MVFLWSASFAVWRSFSIAFSGVVRLITAFAVLLLGGAKNDSIPFVGVFRPCYRAGVRSAVRSSVLAGGQDHSCRCAGEICSQLRTGKGRKITPAEAGVVKWGAPFLLLFW